MSSLPVFRHVAVALIPGPSVTSSPEHLSVPCTERALLCLLNGGVRFVSMSSHFQEDRGCLWRMCPSLELAGLGPVPSPATYLPHDCRQVMVLPTPGFLQMGNTKISFRVCWGFFKDISGNDYVITLPKQRLLLFTFDTESSS